MVSVQKRINSLPESSIPAVFVIVPQILAILGTELSVSPAERSERNSAFQTEFFHNQIHLRVKYDKTLFIIKAFEKTILTIS